MSVLEFVGGSHDGETLNVPEICEEVFMLPLYLDPLPPMLRIKGEGSPNVAEVYQQEEPGKLLFQGWDV